MGTLTKTRETSPTQKQGLNEGADLQLLDPRRLANDPDNERPWVTLETDDKLQALADNIASVGVLDPLRVYMAPGGMANGEGSKESVQAILLSGHRRAAAAILAGVNRVPCLVVPAPKNDYERALLRLSSNLHRRDVSPLMKARSIKEMLESKGMTQEALASALGTSQSSIGKYVAMLSLPEPVQALVEEGTLTVGHAAALAGVREPSLRWDGKETASVEASTLELAKHAASYNLSVRDLESRVKGHNQAAVGNRKYAEEERARKETQAALAIEAARLLAEGVVVEDRETVLALYHEEMAACNRTRDANRKAREALFAGVIQEATAWDPETGPGEDHLRLAAMVMVDEMYGYGYEKEKGNFKKEIEKARTRLDILNLLARIAVGRIKPEHYNVTVSPHGVAPWASSRWKLNERLQALWEERGLVDPPIPVHPDYKPKLEASHGSGITVECETCGKHVHLRDDDLAPTLLQPSGIKQHADGALYTPQGVFYCAECGPQTQFCRNCGCTEDEACEEGCEWVEPDLCSACISSAERDVPCPECKGALYSDFGARGVTVDFLCTDPACSHILSGQENVNGCESCGVAISSSFRYCLECDPEVIEARVDAQLTPVDVGAP